MAPDWRQALDRLAAALRMLSPLRVSLWALGTSPVEDGVGVGRVGDHLVPVIDRQLAGHDGGAAIVPDHR
jgi:hypothetical protein